MTARTHRALVMSAWLAWSASVHAQSAHDPGESERRAGLEGARVRARIGVMVAAGPAEQAGESSHAGVLTRRAARRLSLGANALGLADPTRWPAEPHSPAPISPERLAAALEQLCPPTVSPASLREIAELIVTSALRFEVDAMVLGALVYHQSDCDAARRNSWGTGLTMLNRGIVPPSLGLGSLRYTRRDREGRQVVERLSFEPPLAFDALTNPAMNLRAAAATLRMFRDQCAELDATRSALPHRHYVSHFIWGDRVRSTAPEDSILIARRRLIDYYLGRPDAGVPQVALGGFMIASPLDGPPRLVTSGLGQPREGGRRAHAGVDFLSHVGEPVRAIADGIVRHAASDLTDGTLVDLPPARAALIPEQAMGVRGLFVELAHPDGYRSIYAHLASYAVATGEQVTRGQLIGYVGRTGIRMSDPHLHFGLFQGARVLDPRDALAPLLFAPLLERTTATAARADRSAEGAE